METLVFRPSYELLTKLVSSYLGLAIDDAKRLGFDVYDLYGEDATTANFFKAINDFNPSIIVMGVHGLEDCTFSQNGELMLKACVNDEVMANRVTFILACKTGTRLAPSMVNKGCLIAWAWLEDFVVVMDESYPPLQDPYVYSFLHPILEGLNNLFNDVLNDVDIQTIARDVYETVTNSFNKEIDYWRGVPSPTASQMVTYLIHDRDTFIPITTTGIYTPPEEISVQIPVSWKPILVLGLLFAPLMFKKA